MDDEVTAAGRSVPMPGTRRRRRAVRLVASLLAALTALLFLAGGTVVWLALQPDALQRGLDLLDGVGGVHLEAVDARGSLVGPFTIGKLVVRHERATVTLVRVRGELRLASLLYGTLGVREFVVDDARVEPHAGPGPASPGFLPAWLRVAWDEVGARQLTLLGAAGQTTLTEVSSTGSLTRWTLRSERLEFVQAAWHTQGRLELQAGPAGELRWHGTADGPEMPIGPAWRLQGSVEGRPFESITGPWRFAVVARQPSGLAAQGALRIVDGRWQVEGKAQARGVDLAAWGVRDIGRISGTVEAVVDAEAWNARQLRLDLGRYGRFDGQADGNFAKPPRAVRLAGRWQVPRAGVLDLEGDARWPAVGDARWNLALHGQAVNWRHLPGVTEALSWLPQAPTLMALRMTAHGTGFSAPSARRGRWELDRARLEAEHSRLELAGVWQATADWQVLFSTQRIQDWWPGVAGELALSATGRRFSQDAGELRVTIAEASLDIPGRDVRLTSGSLELVAHRTSAGLQGELSSLSLRLAGVPAPLLKVKLRSAAGWEWRKGLALVQGLCLEPASPRASHWLACSDLTWTPSGVDLQGKLQAPRDLQVQWQAKTRMAAGSGWRDWPLEGHVRGELPAIDFLPSLFEDLDRVAGKVSASLAVGGTLGTPDYRGTIMLVGGELDFVPANLRLRHTTATMRLSPGRMQLEGHATAGEGQLAVDGELRFGGDQGEQGQLRLRGERLLLADVPEARVVASPDLRLQLGAEGWRAEGVVRIPEARLAPQDLTGVVLPSPDERVAGAKGGQAGGLPVSARVQLVMGDAVRLETMGLSGKLQGSVTTTTPASGATTAQGELSLGSGKFKAYTRELDIERGRLLFTGGPASDPGLDLRASRQFPDVKAGVLVRGTLRHPLVRFFAEPARPQNEVASLLLVGRSIEGLQGTGGLGTGLGAGASSAKDSFLQQGGALVAAQLGQYVGLDEVQVERDAHDAASLVLGKYLSPRLYVSYGVGLAEALNTLKLRYTLGRRWVLKTEAGSRQSIDLEYSTAR